MIYLICFCIALLLLLVVLGNGKINNNNIILMCIIVAVSNGGYFALAISSNLQEAILANTISYVLGIFSPIIILFTICDVCRVQVSSYLNAFLLFLQSVLYLSICTVGHNDFFYKTVEFHTTGKFSYLTKTYGIGHTLYLISLMIYTLVGMAVAIVSLSRKTVVSRINVDIILFVYVLSVGVYLVERFLKLRIELMPIFSTATIGIMLIPLIKVYSYSVYNNQVFFESEMKSKACFIIKKNLKYMGCNEHAVYLFPELKNWELEKKIPSNGGRFNTFLRQPLNNYIKAEDYASPVISTYNYKGEKFQYEIGSLLHRNNTLKGFYIQVQKISDVSVELK